MLFLDEPFGALDSITRLIMRGELLRIWEAERKTIIFVTHDIDEAVQLADRVVVMSARPANIQHIVNIDIPHPRDISSPRYLELRDGSSSRSVWPTKYELARRTRESGRSSSGRLLATALLLALWHYSVVWTATKIFPSPLDVEKGIAELMHKTRPVGRHRRFAAPRGHWLWRRGRHRYSPGPDPRLVSGGQPGGEPGHCRFFAPSARSPGFRSPSSCSASAIMPRPRSIFLGAFFPIVVACVDGVSNVPSVFRRAGRNFGLGPAQLLTKVVFPAALPQIIVGLRIALGIAWLVVVAAEMIAVDSGLGYLVIDSRNSGKRYDLVVAAMLMIGLIGLALDIGFRRLEKIKSVRWGFRHES